MSRVRRPPAAECRGGAEVGPRRHAELHHHRRGRRGAPPLIGTQFEGFPRSADTPALQQGHHHRCSDRRRRVSGRQDASIRSSRFFRARRCDIGGLFVPRQDVNYILIGPIVGPDALRVRLSRVRASRGLQRRARSAGVDERGTRGVLQLVRARPTTDAHSCSAGRSTHTFVELAQRNVDAGRRPRGDDP